MASWPLILKCWENAQGCEKTVLVPESEVIRDRLVTYLWSQTPSWLLVTIKRSDPCAPGQSITAAVSVCRNCVVKAYGAGPAEKAFLSMERAQGRPVQ